MVEMRALCREFVKKHSADHDASHDISHIDRVVTNALKIWSLSGDDTQEIVKKDVLIAIASLHDSFDHKYLTTDEAVSKAKAEVSDFLATNCSMNDETIRMVIDVIDRMGFTSEMTEGKTNVLSDISRGYLNIVQDADRLDAIGAVGISRCLAFSGAFGRPIISEDGREETAQREKFHQGSLRATARKGPSGISHFYDKLLFLKDMLKTPAGKKLGQKRHDFLLRFLDEFFDEIDV